MGNQNPDELLTLSRAVDTAQETMQAVHEKIKAAGPTADYDALEAEFRSAERDHKNATARYEREERAVAFAAAKRALPASISENFGGGGGGGGQVRVSNEPLTYERHAPHSIFRDMYGARNGEQGAMERLRRHGEEMRVEQRALTTTDGSAGEFVPPIWLSDEWIALQRASRPVANTLNMLPLPGGTDTINVPKVNSGTTVAVQTDGGAVSSTDITSTSVTAAVQTVAGMQDLSVQAFDLSLPGIDKVIWDDLTRAYATKLDQLVINGAVTNAKGLLQVAGTNAVTFTSASPTVPLLYPKIADAVQRVNSLRFLPPTFIAMTPSRWAWILASLDSQNRPLVVPVGSPGFNAVGMSDVIGAENIVGNLMGLPVVIDANIPQTLGAGTNEDRIIVYRGSDTYLWESQPRLRAFDQVLSGTLQMRLQIYGYMAILAGRLPASISVIGGTGLTSAAF